jgi:hypothetical protein
VQIDLKAGTELEYFTASGRLFQSTGAARAKLLLPNVEVLGFGV